MIADEYDILIVDDSPNIRKLISLILKNEGFSFVEAVNGNDALEKIRLYPADLIITDMRMPVMDGFEFLRRLRADTGTHWIPAIGLWSGFRLSSHHAALVDEWVAKPLIPSRLPDTVRKVLGARRSWTGKKMPSVGNPYFLGIFDWI